MSRSFVRRVRPLGLSIVATLGLAIAAPSLASAQGGPTPATAPPDTYVVVQPQVVVQPPGTPPPGYYPPPGYAPGYAPPGYATGYAPATPAGPKFLDYEEGDTIPPGYHKKTRIRVGLVAGGASMFGVSYLLSIMTAAFGQAIDNVGGGTKDYGPMLIPVVGPFVAIPTTNASTGGAFGLTFLGLTQAGGAAMFIVGLAAPTTRLVRNDLGKRWTLTPTVAPGAYGLGAIGTF